MSDDALRAKFEQKEALWKEQVANLHAKLTQAGNHLKTLAQENARLIKSTTEHEVAEQKDKRQILELSNAALGLLGEDPLETLPINNETGFVATLKQRLEEGRKEADAKIKALEERVKELSDDLKAAKEMPSKPSLEGKCDVDSIISSLKSVVEDDDEIVFPSSLPLELRSILEDLKEERTEGKDRAKKEHKAVETIQNDLKRQITQLQLTVNSLSDEKEKALSDKEEVENQLRTAERERDSKDERIKALQHEHQSLLGKLSNIKETLAPRLEADRQLRHRVNELTAQLEESERNLSQARADMVKHENEMSDQITRKEREISHLQTLVEQLHQEREEWQANAMQADAYRNQLEEQNQVLQAEMDSFRQQRTKDMEEHELERASLSNLQTVLEEFQATKDAEIRAAVEHIERQLEVAKRSWAEYQERARVAEDALQQSQQGVAKTQRYEQDLKEKNLLIGKLRHEAIILNEHLIEAMRRLKEETNENNVDRQLITNLIVGFLVAPRGDRKRFEILTIIASVLQMTDEQKEQIGLLRPNRHVKSPPSTASSTPGWASPQPQQPQGGDTRESFTDAWISFLLKESSSRGRRSSELNTNTSSAPTSPQQKPSLDL